MKHRYLFLSLGVLLVVLGLALSFVSAPKYGLILVAILICDLLAIGCLTYIARLGKAWFAFGVLFEIVALYTIGDVMLRIMLGVRVLDIFR